MAKPLSLFKFRGTFGGMTIVNSKAYGEHIRAPRESVKKAEVNDVMKAYGQRMVSSNVPAKLIKDALEPYKQTFYRGGQLWQRLVEHFAAQRNQDKPYSVEGLAGLNVHQEHPASKVFSSIKLDIETDVASSLMNVTLNYTFCERFLERRAGRDGFLVTLIMLFPDFINNEIEVFDAEFPFKSMDDDSPYSCLLNIPYGASSYLTCFKADPCQNGQMVHSKREPYRVMCLQKAGRVID